MTRERGLTLTLDQLTRIDPLRSDPAPKPTPFPFPRPLTPSPVVQCYCAYALTATYVQPNCILGGSCR